MSYESLKKELLHAVRQHYLDGALANDIRAAIHATDLYAEQLSALELIELSKLVGGKAGELCAGESKVNA